MVCVLLDEASVSDHLVEGILEGLEPDLGDLLDRQLVRLAQSVGHLSEQEVVLVGRQPLAPGEPVGVGADQLGRDLLGLLYGEESEVGGVVFPCLSGSYICYFPTM
jgi:hypothetical protein